MIRRRIAFVKEAALVAVAFVLLVPEVLAGPGVHAGDRPITRSQTASPPMPRAVPPLSVSFVVTTPTQPAGQPIYVDLRSPDGRTRRFAVEGGPSAIQSRQLLLRPGESLTIRLAAAP
jgi:hypothetical protein